MVLKMGQRAPDFALPDQDGRERKLADFTQRAKTVLVFFPFAFSGISDKEMCTLRDDSNKYNLLNAQILGISVDSVYTLKVFAQTYGFKFPLLSDFNRQVSRAYDVLQETWASFGYKAVAKSAVFTLDTKGILRYRWVTDIPSNQPPYDELISLIRKLT